MKPQMFGDGTLTVQGNEVTYSLPKQKINMDSFRELEPLKQEHAMFLTVQDIQEDNHYLKIVYVVDQSYKPFNLLTKKGDHLLKLMVAEDILEIRHLSEDLTTIIHPNNVYFSDVGKVKFMYKSIKNVLPANGFKAIPLMFQLQALILSLFTRKEYNEIKNQGFEPFITSENEIIQAIVNAQSLDDLQGYLRGFREEEQARLLAKQEKKTNRKKPKMNLPVIGVLTGMCLIGGVIGGVSTHFTQVKTVQADYDLLQGDIQSIKKENQQQEGLIKAYRYANQGKTQEAIQQFEALEGLGKEDKNFLAQMYLKQDDSKKWLTAASLNPQLNNDVAKKFLEKKDYENFSKIEVTNSLLQIEQYFIKKDFDSVIKLSTQSKEKRAKQLQVEAYIQKNDFRNAQKGAQSLKDKGLEIKVLELKLKYVQADKKMKKEDKEKQIKGIQDQLSKLKQK